MVPIADIASLILKQSLSTQTLSREPEPDQITTGAENVSQYNSIMMSRFPISYALALEMIDRTLPLDQRHSALDLASGPGHFTICLAKYLKIKQIRGLDLSQPMIDVATRNAELEQVSDRVAFQKSDITCLADFKDGEIDLTCFTFGAHHMPDLETVKNVFKEMDRVTNPAGLIFLMDGVRFRNKNITELYMKSIGYNFVELGLYRTFEELRNSLLAAWTVEEMRTVFPPKSNRNWCQMIPFGLPISQFVVGYPRSRKSPFLRMAKASENPLIRDLSAKWEVQVGKPWTRETLKLWRLSHGLLFSSFARRFHARSAGSS